MAQRTFGLVVLLSLSAQLRADGLEDARLDNWHQWRGPTANGVAPKGGPPAHWSESDNIRWKVEIPGKGSATPIVWKDRIFLLTAVDTGIEPASKDARSADPTRRATPPPTERSGRSRGFRRSMTRDVSTIHEFIILCQSDICFKKIHTNFNSPSKTE